MSTEKIRAGILGATGYTGGILAAILQQHPQAEVIAYGSKSYAGQRYDTQFRNLYGMAGADRLCVAEDPVSMAKEVDVLFTATPQGMASSFLTEDILAHTKVIDLSADFRFADRDVYEKWYGLTHGAPELLSEAVYGLPELYREKICSARLIANPGCYTTCSILTAYPLVKEGLIDHKTIIVDALSGVSGAGRGAKVDNLFSEVNESAKPYGIATHRHTPEIEEHLSAAAGEAVTISFTPHLVPMNRGILATIYATLKEGVTKERVREVYETYYGKETFVRLLEDGMNADTKWVEGSNYIDIAFTIDARTGRIVMNAALDNLMKGAASQAVQNMNIVCGLPEEMGLQFIPVYP